MKLPYALHRCFVVLPALALLAAVAALSQTHNRIRFLENRGQIVDAAKHSRPDILFSAQSNGGTLYLRTTGLSYVFVEVEHDSSVPRQQPPMQSTPLRADTSLRVKSYRMDVEFAGANPQARVERLEGGADVENFYLGHCPQGITDVRSYERVVYHDIYPNIDLAYYTTDRGMKYDFVVRPGGRVSDIRMRYIGSNGLAPMEDGRVVVGSPLGSVEEGRPMAYIERAGEPHPRSVRAGYHLADSTITFDVGAYDHGLPLVIDPTLMWSTYFGGSNYDGRLEGYRGNWAWFGTSCRSDRDTTITILATTLSSDFPTTPGVVRQNQSGVLPQHDMVAVRFNQRGARMWATYIGGTGLDWSSSLALDSLHNLYASGGTNSTDLPTTASSFNQTYGSDTWEGFVIKLNSAGQLLWCTYYNGTYIGSLAVDHAQNLLLGGQATSAITTTPGAFQTTPPPGTASKGFMAKFTGGGARIWTTFLGGTPPAASGYYDAVASIAVGANDTLYASGQTMYADFPIVGAAPFQPALNGASDSWIAKLDSAGHPVWTTFFGGTEQESNSKIGVDSRQNVVVAGSTTSRDLPVTAGAFQPALNSSGMQNGFVAKFDRDGRQLWTTYVGGGNYDFATCLEVDARDAIWTGYYTSSTDFPVTTNAFQGTKHGGYDVAIVEFEASGQRTWGSYVGGGADDYIEGLATTPFGVVIAGSTVSNDFPMAGTPFQSTRNGNYDLFIADFCYPPPIVDLNGHPTHFCQGDTVTLSVPPGYDSYRWSNGATTRSITVSTSGTYAVTTVAGTCTATSDSIAIVVFPTPHRAIRPAGPITICQGDSAILQLNSPARTYRWSNGDTTSRIAVRTAGRYSAFFVDSNGCSNYTDTVMAVLSVRPVITITALGPISFCEGGSVTLDAGAGFAGYAWNTGDSTQRITVTKAGTYSARAGNVEGCWGPVSNSITVKVFPAPALGIRNLLPMSFCDGDSTILTATPATFTSYLWSNGSTAPTVVVRKDGTYTLVATDTNGCTATAKVTVTVKPGPQAKLAVSGPRRFCRGDSVVLAAGGFVQYQWSNGSTASSVVAKESGKYFVTVMNDGGCYGTSDTATVEVMARPSVAISGPVRVCRDALADYSVPSSSRTTYAWDVPGGGTIVTGAATNTVSVQWGSSGSGTLHLRVTNDSTGCSSDTMITVTIGSSLKPLVTANRSLRLCTGDSVTLDAGAYATYQWSTGATTRTVTIGAPGSYTVTVADARGCSGMSDPVDVAMNVPPQPVIAVPNGGAFCAGDSIVLDAGAGYAKYLWSNGFTSQRIMLRATSRVSVTVTDTNGCTGTSAEVQVTAIPVTPPAVNGPQQVCQNSTVTYSTSSTSGSSYQWAVTGGALLSGQGSTSIRVAWGGAGSGRVDLVETNSAGCTGTSPGLDVAIGDHLVPTVTPAGLVALCPGSTIHLDAGAGYASYQWSTGEKTQTIDVTSAGSYAVTVADSSGCSGTSDPVSVFAKATPVPVISGGPLEFCAGGSVILTADAGYMSYLWSTGATTPAVMITTAGSYTVTVMDIDGCSGASKPVDVIVDPLPAKPAITLAGDQLTSTPAAAYQWLLGGAPIAGATGQSLQAAAGGAYQVIITNQFGCSATSDPVSYRTSASARLVTLDTISARVGDRAYLTMRVLPALTAADAVHAYHAELRYDPRALFIHDVISPDRATTGDPAMHQTNVTGLLTVDRPPTSPVLLGDELFRVELEGLVTGQPLNVMTIERIVMPEVTGVSVAGSGLVILSGCEIGMAFSKVVRIETIRPNPAHEEMVVRYRLPAGRTGELRLSDAAGRELVRTTTPVGTGSFEDLRVDLAHVASGAYMIELRDSAERSMVPVVIVK